MGAGPWGPGATVDYRAMLPILLLFDIDGTLLRTSGAGMRAMENVGRRLFGPKFTFAGVAAAGNLDPIIFATAARTHGLKNHDEHHERFRQAYLDELEEELRRAGPEVRAMPGVIDVVKSLVERQKNRGDVVVGLLSGNYAQAAPIKLLAVGLDPEWFSLSVFGDDGATREDLVAEGFRRYARQFGSRPQPQRVIVIGDTPRDIACAKAHHCRVLAVATGPFDGATLRAAGADEVAADLSDPAVLWQMIGD